MPTHVLWCPTCLMAPLCLYGAHTSLFGAPHALWRPIPICLYGAHISLFGAPHALWHPICLFGAPHAFSALHMPFLRPTCLMVPYLPYGTPSAFLVPLCLFDAHTCLSESHLPFASPICLLAPQFFWKNPWKNVWQPKGALVFNTQGVISGWHHHHVQWPISSTNFFCNFCSIFSMCQDVPWSKSSFCVGT